MKSTAKIRYEAYVKELAGLVRNSSLRHHCPIRSGMVSTRMKPCGKANCRCAKDPSAQHGPYHEWHHYQDGRLMHKTVTPDQYAILEGAVANHREILRLLAVWEQETVDLVLSKPDEQKTRSGETR